MIDLERQLRDYYQSIVIPVTIDEVDHGIEESNSSAPLRARNRRRRVVEVPAWALVAVTAAVVLLTIGAAAVLFQGFQEEVTSPTSVTSTPTIDEITPTTVPLSPTTTIVPETTVAPPNTAIPSVTTPATVSQTPDVLLMGADYVAASAESAWAWGSNEIWRYDDGAWSPYSAYPSKGDGDPYITFGGDTLWMLNDSAVFSFDGEELVELPAIPSGIGSLAVDPNSGTLWASGENLYRWDGEEWTNVGHPPNWLGSDWGYVGGIVVTDDGSVWAAGLFAWIPENGGLARYDDTTASWETVRPLGGDEDVPAWSMATSPDGDLWVMLSKWSRRWETATALPEWVLAHRDGDTGEWTVYDEDLPEGFPLVMAADNDTVWLTAGSSVGNFEPIAGVLRFDGRTWTHYLWDTDVTDTFDDIAVAPDGTVWYTQNGALYQLEP